MWYWWFILSCELLTPLCMIVFGRIMWKHCPSKINAWYGYRTARSMKNMETWKFAHAHFGKQWWRIGWILLAPTLLAALLTYHATENTITVAFLIVLLIQSVFLFYPISQTEKALKNKYGEDGTLKRS